MLHLLRNLKNCYEIVGLSNFLNPKINSKKNCEIVLDLLFSLTFID